MKLPRRASAQAPDGTEYRPGYGTLRCAPGLFRTFWDMNNLLETKSDAPVEPDTSGAHEESGHPAPVARRPRWRLRSWRRRRPDAH